MIRLVDLDKDSFLTDMILALKENNVTSNIVVISVFTKRSKILDLVNNVLEGRLCAFYFVFKGIVKCNFVNNIATLVKLNMIKDNKLTYNNLSINKSRYLYYLVDTECPHAKRISGYLVFNTKDKTYCMHVYSKGS